MLRAIFLIITVFVFTSVMAVPRTINKPIVCEETSVVLTTLFSGEYQEFPIWMGTGENSRFSLFANEKTKSWTLIQYDEKIACVLGVGTQYRMVFNGPSI